MVNQRKTNEGDVGMKERTRKSVAMIIYISIMCAGYGFTFFFLIVGIIDNSYFKIALIEFIFGTIVLKIFS